MLRHGKYGLHIHTPESHQNEDVCPVEPIPSGYRSYRIGRTCWASSVHLVSVSWTPENHTKRPLEHLATRHRDISAPSSGMIPLHFGRQCTPTLQRSFACSRHAIHGKLSLGPGCSVQRHASSETSGSVHCFAAKHARYCPRSLQYPPSKRRALEPCVSSSTRPAHLKWNQGPPHAWHWD